LDLVEADDAALAVTTGRDPVETGTGPEAVAVAVNRGCTAAVVQEQAGQDKAAGQDRAAVEEASAGQDKGPAEAGRSQDKDQQVEAGEAGWEQSREESVCQRRQPWPGREAEGCEWQGSTS